MSWPRSPTSCSGLREMARPGQLADLMRRARLAYMAGAEEQSQRALGRALTADELAGVIRRAPDMEAPG